MSKKKETQKPMDPMNVIDNVIEEAAKPEPTPKVDLAIGNAQANSKWSVGSITFDEPVWLKKGDLIGFQADNEIDPAKAFRAICNYALQHLPVSLRGKADPPKHAIAYWLAGAYVAAPRMTDTEYRTYLIKVIGLAPVKVDTLTNAKAKSLAIAHRDLAILTADNAAIASVEGSK